MSNKEDGMGDKACRNPVKSFAEITSCHTINISDNFPCEREEGCEKVGQPAVSPDTKCVAGRGVKRHRSEAEVANGFRQVHSIQYLQESVPEVSQNFEVLSKIGEGTFSSVYLAKLKGSTTPISKVALKHLIPTSSVTRIENEIKCLKIMGGKDNVIELKAYVRHKDHVVLIMPYFPHDKFTDYLGYISVSEVRMYMFALFQALRNVHSHHVIHRDIKPSNFLYHRETRRFRLVDFGLAQLEPGRAAENKLKKPPSMMLPPDTYRRQVSKRVAARKSKVQPVAVPLNGAEKPKSDSRPEINLPCISKHSNDEVCQECQSRKGQVASRAGTPGFRAPEVLLKCPNQTTAVDIWSAGVILLCLLSGHYPFFRAHDDQAALAQIISLMGSKECIKASISLGKELTCDPDIPPVDLKHMCIKLSSSLRTRTSNPKKKTRRCNGAVETVSRSEQPLETPPTTQEDNMSLTGDSAASDISDSWDQVPDSVFDLLNQCLDLNPKNRTTAQQALSHSFFIGMNL